MYMHVTSRMYRDQVYCCVYIYAVKPIRGGGGREEGRKGGGGEGGWGNYM